MSSLILAEHDNSELKPATLNAVTAARALNGSIDILVAGSNCKGAAEGASKIEGVNKVLVGDSEEYANALAENVANLVSKIADNYSHILATATTSAKNIMPRVAALRDVQQISEISEVIDTETFVRPIYAGNAMATVKSLSLIHI